MNKTLQISNVRLPLLDEERLYTVEITDGKWSRIEPQPEQTADSNKVPIDEFNKLEAGKNSPCSIDAQKKIMLPGLVDAHMHLDKSFSLPCVGNVSGTLEEAVRNYAAASPSFSKEEIKARMMRAALQAVSYGTTTIRTHLDFRVKHGREIALRTIEAALEVKETLAPYVVIQLFPMYPFHQFTSEEMEIAEEALVMGVDGVGGAPHLSDAPEDEIDAIFRMAEKYNRPIDLHTDESDNPADRTVSHIAKRTIDYGFAGRVTVDHLCSLASMTDQDAEQLIQAMADAKLSAVTLPGANLYLQGRYDGYPVRRGVTRVKEITEAGIPIATASDNIHDPFHPFGKADLVQIGLITAYAAHMGRPEDLRQLLRMITEIPATIMGLSNYGIKVGHEADFVLLDGLTPEELFTMLPERRWVYRRGQWLRLASPRSNWANSTLHSYWQQVAEVVGFQRDSMQTV